VAGAEKGKQGINTPFQPTLQSPSPSPCRCRLARFRGSLCMPRLGFRSLPIGQQVSISGLDHQLSQMTCSGKLLMNMTTIISRGGSSGSPGTTDHVTSTSIPIASYHHDTNFLILSSNSFGVTQMDTIKSY
jgi:hypothetical protein